MFFIRMWRSHTQGMGDPEICLCQTVNVNILVYEWRENDIVDLYR